MERLEIIKINATLGDPKGILIPRGVMGKLTMEIADEVATFWFTDHSITRRFAAVVMKLENARGAKDTIYLERFQKIVTKYVGKSKEQIRDLVLLQLKTMGAHIKK